MAGYPLLLRRPPGPPIAKPFDLSIEVTRAQLTVRIDDAELATWGCDHRTMHGDWGVAANRVVWLANLRCEPLPAK